MRSTHLATTAVLLAVMIPWPRAARAVEASSLAPGSTEPVSAQPVSAEPVSADPRGHLRVVVALDNSGSMKRNGLHERVRAATAKLVDDLSDDDEVGLVLFDGGARVAAPIERLGGAGARTRLQTAIRAVRFDGGRTNIPEAVERGLYELRDGRDAEDVSRALVVLTDGVIDTGDAKKDAELTRWLRESLLPDSRDEGVPIFGVAFTEDADYRLLQQMARETSGAYFRALTPADVSGLLSEVRVALADHARARKPVPVVVAPAPQATGPKVEIHRVEVPVPMRTEAAESPLSPVLITLALSAVVLGLAIVIIGLLRARAPAGRDGDGREEMIPPGAALKGLSTSASCEITKRLTEIGRRDSNDLVIPERTISGQHARVEYRDGMFHVSDLRSMNGTFVNDKRVEGETILRDGDVLRFDRYAFRFQGGLPAGFSTVLGPSSMDSEEFNADRTMMTSETAQFAPRTDLEDSGED